MSDLHKVDGQPLLSFAVQAIAHFKANSEKGLRIQYGDQALSDAGFHFVESEYVPRRVIETYFSSTRRIDEIIWDVIEIHLDISALRKIRDKYLEAFCILICIHSVPLILDLITNPDSDSRHSPWRSLPLGPQGEKLLRDRGTWKLFQQEQWRFVPYRFDETSIQSQLWPRQILPMRIKEHRHCKPFMFVSTVRVDPSYDRMGGTNNTYLFRSIRAQLLTREQHMNEQHEVFVTLWNSAPFSFPQEVVKLFGSFHQDGVATVITEYAPCTRLDNLWKTSEHIITIRDKAQWDLIKQVAGSLSKLHNVVAPSMVLTKPHQAYRYHVTPSRIVVFGSLHGEYNNRVWKLAAWVGGQDIENPDKEYDPPEAITIGDKPSNLTVNGQAADVWSLACVLSVMATWTAGGPKLVNEYAEARQTARIRLQLHPSSFFHDDKKVLDVVSQWHQSELQTRVGDPSGRLAAPLWNHVLQYALCQDPSARCSLSHLTMQRFDIMDPQASHMGADLIKQLSPGLRISSTRLHRRSNDGSSKSRRSSSTKSGKRNESIIDEEEGAFMPVLKTSPDTHLTTLPDFNPHAHASNCPQANADDAWKLPYRSSALLDVYKSQGRSYHANEREKLVQERLEGRHFLIIIDHSSTMYTEHWSEVALLFQCLVAFLNQCTVGSIQVSLTTSTSTRWMDNPESLLLYLGIDPGNPRMQPPPKPSHGLDLSNVLQWFESQWELSDQDEKTSGSDHLRNGCAISIVYLTDGYWYSNKDEIVESVIAMCEYLDLQTSTIPKQIGVQFVYFGQSEPGISELRQLASLHRLHGLKRNIVSVEPANGNMWNMIYGSALHAQDHDAIPCRCDLRQDRTNLQKSTEILGDQEYKTPEPGNKYPTMNRDESKAQDNKGSFNNNHVRPEEEKMETVSWRQNNNVDGRVPGHQLESDVRSLSHKEDVVGITSSRVGLNQPNNVFGEGQTPHTISQSLERLAMDVSGSDIHKRTVLDEKLRKLVGIGDLPTIQQTITQQRELSSDLRSQRIEKYIQLGFTDQEVAEILLDLKEASCETPDHAREDEGNAQYGPLENTALIENQQQHPSPADVHRLEWTCQCGEQLFDDYVEIVPGSLQALEKMLQSQTQFRPVINRHHLWPMISAVLGGSSTSPSSSSQSTASRGDSSTGITTQSQTLRNPTSATSQDTTGVTSCSHPGSNTTNTLPSVLYLLLCLPESLSGVRLHHEQLLTSASCIAPRNDRQLFQLLRKVYVSQRSLMGSKLTLRTVTRVSLTRFVVDLTQFVDVKPHAFFCTTTPSGCDCIPPKDLLLPAPNAEYACDPIEPEFSPPIGINYLTHAFQHPDHLSDRSEWILNQIPKRMAGQLMAVSGNKPIKGWGLAFEEGWDRRRIRLAFLTLIGLGSLVFGVIWSVFKKDISSAFNVAAYWVALAAIIGGYYGTAEAGFKVT